MSRKIRFVCVSDTHNASPATGAFKLPKGDVLIHAGDLTNQGTCAELRRTLDWIQAADFRAKIVIAGNHDITLDRDFYAKHVLKFHNQCPQDSQACIDLFNECPSIKYLNHESAVIRLSQDEDTHVRFKVFGSPYSPANGLWAFGYSPEKAPGLWDQIPLDVDIVVTHTPPKHTCDRSKCHVAMGCETLQQKIWQIRPRLTVCGHIHEARGAERILWDSSSANINNGQPNILHWIDPGYNNKKQSFLDLSSRELLPLQSQKFHETVKTTFEAEKQFTTEALTSPTSWAYKGSLGESQLLKNMDGSSNDSNLAAFAKNNTLHANTEASLYSMKKKETCIINAAIMASSWPHRGSGGKCYNKPIVLDINLPVYSEKITE